MKSISTQLLAGVVALGGWTTGAWAKTIVVDSHEAAFFVEPASHLPGAALSGPAVGAGFTATATPIGPQWAWRYSDWTRMHTALGSPAALSGLYQEARRLALTGAYIAGAPALRDDTSKIAPAQRGDLRAMLLLGALLIAHQLRRKHRSLKQSLIAG